jgi:hypothetical protein
MTPSEAAAHARRIIDTIRYVTIATADGDGRPWASPVWFVPASPTEFLWASDPVARHSRNIATRTDVALVICDSTVPIGGAEAVYVEAMAEELRGVDLEQAVTIFSHRSQEVGAPEWTVADVMPPARFRLYRATASRIFVLDRGDRRIELNLDDLHYGHFYGH